MKHVRYVAIGNTGMRDGKFSEDGNLNMGVFDIVAKSKILLQVIIVVDELLSIYISCSKVLADDASTTRFFL
jgi:hypothetical protein